MTTASPGRRSAAPLSLWIVGAYVVALLAFPADFGPRIGGVVFSVARLVLLAAIVVALVDWRAHLSAARALPRAIWLGWLAFLGSALVTAALFPSSASWARYGSLILEGVVVLLLVYRAALAPNGVRTLVIVTAGTTVAIAGVVLVFAAFGQHYDQILAGIAGTTPLAENSTRLGLERQAGPFRAPLYFGIWMSVASALLLPWMMERGRRARWFAWGAWLIVLGAVFLLTTSRLATTAMFIMAGVYLLYRRRVASGAAFLAAAAVVGIAFSALTVGLDQATGPGPSLPDTSLARLAAIQAALEAVRQHPLFGWGLLTDVGVLSGLIGVPNYVDNAYLSFLVELGIVGTASFLLLIGLIVVIGRRAASSGLGLAIWVALVGYLAMGLFASNLKASQGYAALFVIGALTLAAAGMRSDGRDHLILGAETPAPTAPSIPNVPAERRDGDSDTRA